MPRYRVRLFQTVVEETTVEVDTATPEMAEDEAVRLALAGKVEWRFLEAPDTPEVASAPELVPVAPA